MSMNFEEFIVGVKEGVRKRFPEAKVAVNEIVKNNNLKLNGLVIMQGASGIAPTIYLEGYYERYVETQDFKRVLEEIIEVYENHKNPSIDYKTISEYETIKDRIVYKLINYEKNKELLQDVPYRRFNDLAVVYYITLDCVDESGACTCLIKNNLMYLWKKSEEELFKLAEENSPIVFKANFTSMADTLKNFKAFDDEDEVTEEMLNECGVYVLTNESKHNGAAVMLYEGVLRGIADNLKTDLIIIPSSIHELIILSDNKNMVYDYVLDIVREVNGTLMTEEVLSNNIYKYIRSEDRTVIIE